MSVFQDEQEIYKYIGGVFEKGLEDPTLSEKLKDSKVVVEINYTDPTAVLTVDMENGKVYRGGTDEVTPNIKLFMSADNGNKFWLGKLNLASAMAKGQVRAKGPVAKLLKMLPNSKAMFPLYKEMLEADGRQDLMRV